MILAYFAFQHVTLC